MLKLTDNDTTRAMWPHPFEATYEARAAAASAAAACGCCIALLSPVRPPKPPTGRTLLQS